MKYELFKKLVVIFGAFYSTNLFAAAEEVPSLPQTTAVSKKTILDLPSEILTGLLFDKMSAQDQLSFRHTCRDAYLLKPTKLFFNMKTIQEEESGRVAEFLRNPSLQSLKIKSIKTPVLVAALTTLSQDPDFKFHQMAELDLEDNRDITSSLLDLFNTLMPNLKALNVQNCRPGEREVASISQMKNLRVLDISSNKIGPVDAASLSQLKKLTTLNISFNNIKDEGAASLSKLKNLTTLNVSFNYIGDAGAASLSQLSQLTTLDVSENGIRAAGANSISQLSQLTTLNIKGNHIEIGAAFLSQLKKLTTLDIADNDIGDAGATSISQMSQLITLDVSANNIGDEGKIFLRQRLLHTTIQF